MADSADLRSLAIRATKGNELMEFISEDMQKGMFQATLAASIESTMTIRVRNTICALGSRGDYIEAVMFCSAGEATDVPNLDTMYVELVDYTGVPASVQHTIFGEVSPFISPSERLEASMLNGIDRQELSITNSEAIADEAACNVGKSQYTRGTLDSRITFQCDHKDIETITEMSLKFKPNSDGVFLINAGARIWANPGADALG
jgi:hypothetical protein